MVLHSCQNPSRVLPDPGGCWLLQLAHPSLITSPQVANISSCPQLTKAIALKHAVFTAALPLPLQLQREGSEGQEPQQLGEQYWGDAVAASGMNTSRGRSFQREQYGCAGQSVCKRREQREWQGVMQ